jgi:hypothetical protein
MARRPASGSASERRRHAAVVGGADAPHERTTVSGRAGERKGRGGGVLRLDRQAEAGGASEQERSASSADTPGSAMATAVGGVEAPHAHTTVNG